MGELKEAFRGSLIGQFIYDRFNGRVLKYKEDWADYVPDEKYVTQISMADDKKDSSFVEGSIRLNPIQVTFDGDDDPEHPNNWPNWVKFVYSVATFSLTCLVYISVTIVSPAVPLVMEEFGVSDAVAALTVSLFVYGYGVGSMVFSPLSEYPEYGRNFFYATTLFVFAILQIPSVFVQNFAGLAVLRLLSGIFLSPVLATGGATFVDMFAPAYAPIVMSLWSVGSFLGVSLGPLFGASLIQATGDWRWSFWLMMILAVAHGVLFCVLPETYSLSVLHRKAQRLKRVTDNTNLTVDTGKEAQSHLDACKEILWRACIIGFTEPVVILINIYVPMVYALTYVWLEAFPIVYTETHHFGPIASQLPYLSVFIGASVGSLIYSTALYKPYTLATLAGKPLHAEVFMPVSIFGSLFTPSALFLFGWTSASDIHWIFPVLSGVLFGISATIIFLSLMSYIAFSFPRYVASAFAGNSLARAFIAGSFPLFGRSLFVNLPNKRFPVAYGSTILGCISVLMVFIPVLFYLNGKKLRAHSKFSGY